MAEPLAYLFTWTCYGTWLHGDARGSVDADHSAPGAPFLPPDAPRCVRAAHALRWPAVRLDTAGRRLVYDTVVAHCARRAWTLHALQVRSNHVHAVVACDIVPKQALNQLKAWTTRRVREVGLVAPRADVWTEGGSGRWLWDEQSLRRAVEYVMEFQGDDLP